jgi:hypothetical protein
MVADGDTIAVDLLSSDGRPKMVDHIQISIKPDPPPAGPNLVPRDFTLDDGPLSLKFAIPFTCFVNGRPHSLGWHIAGGSMMWLALPGRGSYVLSLTPCEGNFKKSGAIRDHVITFQADGDHYELRTSGPILGSGGAWNLYVFPEPSVDPKGPLFGIEDWKCGDPSQWWIPNSPTKSSH